MRSAILQLPSRRNSNERRQVLRAAIRRLPVETFSPARRHRGQGLDRAEIYLSAVTYMDIDDRPAQRLLRARRVRARRDARAQGCAKPALRLRAGHVASRDRRGGVENALAQ